MHNVGRVIRATYANQGITFYKLQIEKTTWKENFVEKYCYWEELKNSPAYRDSVIIKEKPVGMTRPLMPCELDMVS